MKLPAKMISAAMVCQAKKSDARDYLQAINVTKEHIEATNGHVAIQMSHSETDIVTGIYRINAKAPAKAESVEFIISNDINAVRFIDKYDEEISICSLTIIDAKYPDINKIIKQSYFDDIVPCLNVEYLANLSKMFKCNYVGVNQEFFGELKAVKFTLHDDYLNEIYGHPVYIVMPIDRK